MRAKYLALLAGIGLMVVVSGWLAAFSFVQCLTMDVHMVNVAQNYVKEGCTGEVVKTFQSLEEAWGRAVDASLVMVVVSIVSMLLSVSLRPRPSASPEPPSACTCTAATEAQSAPITSDK